jgi:hypothetical protein
MEFPAHEMGGSPCAANLVGIFAAFVLSPAFAGLKLSCLDTWGFARKASLHPRLYAFACSAGLKPTLPRYATDPLQVGADFFDFL